MTKYVVAILVFVAALAGLLLYVGDDARLVMTSTAESGILKMNPIDMSWQAVIVISTLFVIGLLTLWTFLSWLWSLPGRMKSGVGLRRRTQALDAMEDTLIAAAHGDAEKTRKRAEKMRKLISHDALGRIISAQAAVTSGDTVEAINQYRAMLDHDKTLPTAQQGLARQYLATGDLSGAIEHAGNAYQDNKNARWAFDALFQAQVSDSRWAQALETLELGQKRKHIDKDTARRRRAVLETALADDHSDDGDTTTAADIAEKAVQSAPDFAPAAALAANLHVRLGETRKAMSLIEKAWTAKPHPALSVAYKSAMDGKSDKDRAKRVNQLIKNNPTHRESVILKVEEALRAQDGVTAWSELSPLLQNDEPTARLCLLAAQSETMLKNPSDAAIWTERAATAASDPDWSDLDPAGDAFDYDDKDWRRLVFSFGEDGSLIHPRFESGAAMRAIPKLIQDEEVAEDDTDEVDTEIAIEESATARDVGEDDLALRLDSLLDNDPKT